MISRLLLGLGGALLLLAPFFPYTHVTVLSWSIALKGIYCSGGLMALMGMLLLLQACGGHGNVISYWLAAGLAGGSLYRDMHICGEEIGRLLGRAQLSLQGVNQGLAEVGITPLTIVEPNQINNRTWEIGVYMAVAGLVLVLLATLWRWRAQGMAALWMSRSRCRCGRRMENSFAFCPHCGRAREGIHTCPHCSEQLGSSFAFCPRCGQRLTDAG